MRTQVGLFYMFFWEWWSCVGPYLYRARCCNSTHVFLQCHLYFFVIFLS